MNTVPQTDYDVVIVGGGLVGASLACALIETDFRVLVIEAVPFRSDKQPSFDDRTVALAQGSRRILEGLGVWSSLGKENTSPIKTIHISDRGKFGFARLHARDANLEALGYVVPTRALGAALLLALEQASNITVLCPAEVNDVNIVDATVNIELDHEQHSSITAKLLVAADGVHSSIRKRFGIPYRQQSYEQTAIVTNVETELFHDHIAYERFMSTGPLALLPMGNTRSAVVWSVPSCHVEEMLQWDDDGFLDELQNAFGDRLGNFNKIGKRAAYPLALTEVEDIVKDRLVLIGNAAHTVHPVAGQGFNLGLRDVATLAEELVDAHRVGQDIASTAVLKRYRQRRQHDTATVSRFTDSLIRIFSNSVGPIIWLRNAGLIAVDLFPGAKHFFIHRTSGLSGRLPRLSRGLPL